MFLVISDRRKGISFLFHLVRISDSEEFKTSELLFVVEELLVEELQKRLEKGKSTISTAKSIFQKIQLLDKNGKKTSAFKIGEKIIFRIKVDITADLNSPKLHIRIHDKSDKVICIMSFVNFSTSNKFIIH